MPTFPFSFLYDYANLIYVWGVVLLAYVLYHVVIAFEDSGD